MDHNRPKCPLLDLPPELREKIYHLCFIEAAQTRKHRPQEPPLTSVSKRIRAEALPIYYSTYTLRIHTYVKCDSYGFVRLSTTKWYHDLHPDKLKHVERFTFRFVLVQQYTGELVPIEFYLSLYRREQSYSLTYSFDRAWFRNPHRIGDPADFEDVLEVLRGHLFGSVDALVDDPGIGSWRAVDLDRLVKVDPDSLPLQTIS